MRPCAIGIDVGGTTTKVGVMGLDRSLASCVELPTPRDVTGLVRLLSAQVHRLRALHGDATPVGVVVPGVVDEAAGTVLHSANLGWHDVPARELISCEIGPCAFGHDVRAGALAESHHGVGHKDLLFVPIGTGIAAALVLDGVAWGTPWTGEIGQSLVPDPDSGSPVPLEQIASAAALARRYAARSPTFPAGSGARHVVELLEVGDDNAALVFGQAVEALGDVLAVCSSLLGPVPIIVGGGLSRAGDHLLHPLRARLQARLSWMPTPEVIPAALGVWAGCRGAALLALGTQPTGEPS